MLWNSKPTWETSFAFEFWSKIFFYIQSKPKKTLLWDQKTCTSVTHFDVQNSTYAIKDEPNGMAYINRGFNCKLFIKLPNSVFYIFYQISKLGKLSIFYIFMHFGTIPGIVTILNGQKRKICPKQVFSLKYIGYPLELT